MADASGTPWQGSFDNFLTPKFLKKRHGRGIEKTHFRGLTKLEREGWCRLSARQSHECGFVNKILD